MGACKRTVLPVGAGVQSRASQAWGVGLCGPDAVLADAAHGDSDGAPDVSLVWLVSRPHPHPHPHHPARAPAPNAAALGACPALGPALVLECHETVVVVVLVEG